MSKNNRYALIKLKLFVIMSGWLLGGFGLAGAKAQLYYSAGHGDFGIEYEGSTEFIPHWHLDAGSVVGGVTLMAGQEYAVSELTAYVSTERSASAYVADWLGVASGATIWQAGSSANPPNLGFATHADEVGYPEEWQGEAISITLSGWSSDNPGEVAFYQSIPGLGLNLLWFSTYDVAATQNDNTWSLGVGSHEHLSIVFSDPGYYELEFTWNGTYLGDGGSTAVSGVGTFGFQVVPEPGTWTLLGIGLGVLWLTGVRRKKLRQGGQ